MTYRINQVADLFEKQAAVKSSSKPTEQELRLAAKILKSWKEYAEFKMKTTNSPSSELIELNDLLKSGYHNAANALSVLSQLDDI
jgi:hypothetical protein